MDNNILDEASVESFCNIHLSIFFSSMFITLACISVAGLRSRIQKSITNVFDRFHSRTKEFGDLGKVGPKEDVHACVDCMYMCCFCRCTNRPFEEQVMHRNFWNSYFTRTPLKRTFVFAALVTLWIVFLIVTLILSFALALWESLTCTPWKFFVLGFLICFVCCTFSLIAISLLRLWIIYWDLSWVLGSPMEDFPESEQVVSVPEEDVRDFVTQSELPSLLGHRINIAREEERERQKLKTNFLMGSTVKRFGHYPQLEDIRGQRGGDHVRPFIFASADDDASSNTTSSTSSSDTTLSTPTSKSSMSPAESPGESPEVPRGDGILDSDIFSGDAPLSISSPQPPRTPSPLNRDYISYMHRH